MKPAAAFRGQPLLLLAGLLAIWIALRAALWQSPFSPLREAGLLSFPVPVVRASGPVPEPMPLLAIRMPKKTAVSSWRRAAPRWPSRPATLGPAVPVRTLIADPIGVRAVVGHNLLLAAGLSGMELPPYLRAYLQGLPAGVPAAAPATLAAAPRPAVAKAASRWSAEGWLLLRQDGASTFAADRPSYGRSQAGAVVRYSLAPASAHRPQVYVRASAALSGWREREVAAGLSARPLAGVPLRIAAEARVSETRAGTEVRPAVYAVSELPPLALPYGARGEAYLQAGYVGGRFATAFVDGQWRIERPLARRGETELVAGVGVWGGAQEGAARLDIGPTAAVSFRLGRAQGRLTADYRFRAAGEAEPASGPALTVSAGF